MINRFPSLFNIKKPVIAMIHMKGDTRCEKIERAKQEIEIYYENGIDAVIVEDYFGTKYDLQPVLEYMNSRNEKRLYGINILDNFHRSFELAVLYGASFIQIDSVAGHLPQNLDVPFGRMIEEYRNAFDVCVLGGVRFKYQPYLSGRTLADDLKIGAGRCDAIVVTGEGTGIDTNNEKLREFRKILCDFPMIVGAGVTEKTCGDKLSIVDAVIAGSCFKDTGKDSGDVSARKVHDFMIIVNRIRKRL
jgi:predicted TIM-barrel enzyme